MREQEFEASHLLPCSDCGVPNGLNAMRCWSCGAALPGADASWQRGALQLADPPSAAAGANASGDRARAGWRLLRGAAVAAALVLAAVVAWPPAPGSSSLVSEPAGRVADAPPRSIQPPRLSVADAPAVAPTPVPQDQAHAVASAPAPVDAREAKRPTTPDREQVARALGLVRDGNDAVDRETGRKPCEQGDAALGLCGGDAAGQAEPR